MKNMGLGIAGALFYAAPIGAGLTGAAYFAALPFAGLFILWILVMRAEPFRDGPAFVLPTLMVHLALASMCLGLGQLLRALFKVDATVPLLAWLAMGLGALALGRIIWKPKKEAEMEAFLEKALKSLNDFADDAEEILDHDPDLPLNHPTPAEAAALAAAFGALETMPAEAATVASVDRILRPLDANVRSHVLMDALLRRAAQTGTRRDRHAALRLAAEPNLAWRERGNRRLAAVFDLIVEAADTTMLAHFLGDSHTLLDDFPAAAVDLPEVPRLLDIASQIDEAQPDLSDALVELAHRIEDIAREPEE